MPEPPRESLPNPLDAIPRFRALKPVGAVLLTALTLAQPAHAAPSCHIPAGRTFASNRIAKLIRVPTPDGAALYACIRRTGRKVALDIGFADARLAGRWVAWQRRAVRGEWRIDVHDLRTGRERLVDGHVTQDALFLTTTGTIVWAQRLTDDIGVFANDVATGGHLLGRGAVDPASLRLDGRRVSWRAGGDLYTADVR
jgi:hypothetical protein